MSMQDASTSGLATASEAKRRYKIVPLHNARAPLSDMLKTMWAGQSTQEAHDILAMPDVLVTNQGDKLRQLPKIKLLNETIKQELGTHALREPVLRALAHAVAAKDAGTLTTALLAAEKAGLAPANLETGRKALSATEALATAKALAAANAHGERQKVLDAFSEARDAFERAQQLAKNTGNEVKLTSDGSTYTVTVLTPSDGKLESLELKGLPEEGRYEISLPEPKSSACLLM